MATLYSTHCRLSNPSLHLQSSSSSSSSLQSSPLSSILQRVTFSSSSKRFVAAQVSLKSQPDSHQIPVQTHQHDGAVATVTHVDNDILNKGLKAELSASLESKGEIGFEKDENESTVSITIVGASGDLAKKKIFPALFALYYEGCLPKHFTIYGYARSKMTDAELRNMVSKTLTCRIDKRENCSEKMDQFLKRCFYHSGQYDSQENFAALDKKLKEHEVIGEGDNVK